MPQRWTGPLEIWRAYPNADATVVLLDGAGRELRQGTRLKRESNCPTMARPSVKLQVFPFDILWLWDLAVEFWRRVRRILFDLVCQPLVESVTKNPSSS